MLTRPCLRIHRTEPTTIGFVGQDNSKLCTIPIAIAIKMKDHDKHRIWKVLRLHTAMQELRVDKPVQK